MSGRALPPLARAADRLEGAALLSREQLLSLACFLASRWRGVSILILVLHDGDAPQLARLGLVQG
jgi:hypothetical protein